MGIFFTAAVAKRILSYKSSKNKHCSMLFLHHHILTCNNHRYIWEVYFPWPGTEPVSTYHNTYLFYKKKHFYLAIFYNIAKECIFHGHIVYLQVISLLWLFYFPWNWRKQGSMHSGALHDVHVYRILFSRFVLLH